MAGDRIRPVPLFVKWVLLAYGAFSVFLLPAGQFLAMRNAAFVADSVPVELRIAEVRRARDGAERPVYAFRPPGGGEILYGRFFSIGGQRFEVGQTVPGRWQERTGKLMSDQDLQFYQLFTGIMRASGAIAMVGMAFYGLRKWRRRSMQKDRA